MKFDVENKGLIFSRKRYLYQITKYPTAIGFCVIVNMIVESKYTVVSFLVPKQPQQPPKAAIVVMAEVTLEWRLFWHPSRKVAVHSTAVPVTLEAHCFSCDLKWSSHTTSDSISSLSDIP